MITPRSRTATRPLLAVLGAFVLLSGLLPMARISTADAAVPEVNLTALDVPSSQNFDTLPTSGALVWANDVTIPGWLHARTGTGTAIVASNGSSNAGNLYSFGTGTSTDRALGSIGSGNAAVLNVYWGVRLFNGTGSTITSLDVAYTGEQWRNGGVAAAQTVAFSYLVQSEAITGSLADFQATGTAITDLDFTSPIFSATASALDGNAVTNRTLRSATISGLSIPAGTEIMLRWFDPDHTGGDHGLSIDDFSVTPHGVLGPTVPRLSINDVSMAEGNAGTTAYTFTVSLSDPAPAGGVTFDIATANASATEPGDYAAASLTGQTIPEGGTNYSFTVSVTGDTTVEPDESFLVNVTNVTGANVGDNQGTGTIQNDDVAPPQGVFIHDVQGNGAATPIAGTTVTIEGVVVGDFQTVGTGQLRGFFLQEEDAETDANPATSEGIFVFCNTCPTAVEEGDRVQATGAVSEFNGMTQITASTAGSIAVISTGNTVSASSIDLPVVGVVNDFYESREGMKVTFVDDLTVSEYFEMARFGHISLFEGGRPEQFTETDAPSAAGLVAHLDDLARREVTLDDDDNGQQSFLSLPIGEQFVYYPQANGGFGLGTQGTDFFRGGDTVSGLTGVLHWSFPGTGANTWRIRPTAGNPVTFHVDNERPATPPAVGGAIKAVGMNLLNYFTTIDPTTSNTSGPCGPSGLVDCRGADSVAELDRQRERASVVICDLNADVYGFMELENTTPSDTINDLLGAVNARCGDAHPYAAVDTGGTLGTDAIRVQLVYRSGILSPVGSSLSDLDPVHNRPPTAQTFDVIDASNLAVGERFTVIANHFKSKGCGGETGGDLDSGDGQGCFNATRTAQASRLLAWIDSTVLPAAGDPDVLLLGDFNAYAKEDPITTLVAGGYTDLAASLQPGSYSYLFDGQLGHLDYGLASASLVPQVTGVDNWHINADEVPLFDYNDEVFDIPGEASFEAKPDGSALVPPRVVFEPGTPYRASDHDPVIVGLFIDTTEPDTVIDSTPADPTTNTSPTFTFHGTDDVTPAGDITFECDLDDAGFETCSSGQTYLTLGLGSHTFQVRAIDAVGNTDTTPASFTWTIQPPDTSSPTVTIDEALGQDDPTDVSPINFTVVFSEDVIDFGDGDVSLSGTAGATTAVVTGEGTTYNVAVSGMTSDGTVIATIEAGAATDPAGNTNTASTSIDNTVTFIVNGAPTATVTDGRCPTGKAVSGSISLSLVDPDGDPLTLTLNSNNNPSLVPMANVVIGGSGSTRTISVTATDKKNGLATLTFYLSDGDETVPVVVTVNVGTNKTDTLAGTEGIDLIFGLEGRDTINGLGGNDLLCGGVGDDIIDGGAGNDVIGGAAGNDSIDGGLGNDILRGDSGADSLTGGAGEDAFSGGQGIDAATDFDAGDGDTQDGSIP